MSSKVTSVAIIVLNWNDHDGTDRATQILLSIVRPGDQIIVVDNGSKSKLHLAANPQLTVIRSEHNLGFAGGNNLGIELAVREQFPLVLLLNADARIKRDNLESLRNYLSQQPDISIVGPVLQEGEQKYHGGTDVGRYLNTRITQMHSTHQLQYVPGTAIMIRTQVFEKIGLLDEDYFFSGEIADFCRRATKAGYHLSVNHDTTVLHKTESSPGELRKTLYVYYNFRNRFLFIRKHHRAQSIRYQLKWIYLGLIQYLGSLKNLDSQKARAIRLAIVDGFLGKFGNQNDKFI